MQEQKILQNSPIPKILETFHEIIRNTKVEPFRMVHFERKIPLARALDFLGSGKLELIVVTNIIPDHLIQDVVD